MSLFSRRETSPIPTTNFSAFDSHISITGDVETDGALRIDGRLEGSIHRADLIVVGEGASVIGDITADFVYARLMGTKAKEKRGYPAALLKTWAGRARDWEKGASPKKELLLAPPAPKKKREVFLFVISGAKEKNPAAAQGILAEL